MTFRIAGQFVLPSCHLVSLSSLHVHTQKWSPVLFRSSVLLYCFQGTQPKSMLCVPSCASYLLSIHSLLSFQSTSRSLFLRYLASQDLKKNSNQALSKLFAHLVTQSLLCYQISCRMSLFPLNSNCT